MEDQCNPMNWGGGEGVFGEMWEIYLMAVSSSDPELDLEGEWLSFLKG